MGQIHDRIDRSKYNKYNMLMYQLTPGFYTGAGWLILKRERRASSGRA